MSKLNDLASNNNTTLDADAGSHKMHLWMTHWDNEDNDDGVPHIKASISMHLPLEEVEELIKGLKLRLVKCYEARVKAI